MTNIWTIAKRELNAYFASPIAYIVLAMFALIFGFFFYASTAAFMNMALKAAASRGQAPPVNLNDYIVRPLLGNASVIILFLMPMITMRLFAEEKRSGTIELLLTSPLTDLEIIVGKWLATLMLYAGLLLISALNIGVLFAYGKPDWQALLVGYLGLILMGASFLSIGAFLSSTTKNQIVAATLTFGVFLMLWVVEWVSFFSFGPVATALSYLSITSHFESFSKGVLELKDVVYYLSMIFLGLFLTSRSMESLRWRS
jgi:ABC-2 type transport system permease protein